MPLAAIFCAEQLKSCADGHLTFRRPVGLSVKNTCLPRNVLGMVIKNGFKNMEMFKKHVSLTPCSKKSHEKNVRVSKYREL